jgi:hypothetical protein
LFVLLPHDDALLPTCLDAFVSVLADNPDVGYAYAAFRTIDEEGGTQRFVINHRENHLWSCEETLHDMVQFFHPIQLAMARTAALRSVGGFDRTFGCFSDIHLWAKVTFQQWQSYYLCQPLSCNRVHEGQGQQFFRQDTAESMVKLSEHYGRTLDRQFYADNNYNQVFFNFIQYFVSEMQAHGYRADSARRMLAKSLVRSHLQNLALSVRNRNGFMIGREMAVFRSLGGWSGYADVGRYYAEVVAETLARRVSRRQSSASGTGV